jgi:flavorubredoxin
MVKHMDKNAQNTINELVKKIETLQAICEAFGITLSQFFLEDEQSEVLSKDEKELVESFRRLPPEKQQALLKFIDR